MKVTLSVIKADIGGYVGHSGMHPRLMEIAEEALRKAKDDGVLLDYVVMRVGDDLELLMTHEKGLDSGEIHKLAWDTFMECTEEARRLKLYGAGQDLLADTFSGNVKGMGPGAAEIEFEERPSEPLVVFMADKTSPGAWNLALYKMFADPFNTPGLVIDPSMREGFIFEILDLHNNRVVSLKAPEESYAILALIGAPEEYTIRRVIRAKDNEVAAVSSTQRLSLIAGRYIGKDDPVLIVRSQSGFPAIGEILEPFANPYIVPGWMRGSHHGPLMPVAFFQANPTRFDGPPRVIAAGFQMAQGHLVGPRDLFDDPAFDDARRQANELANYLRRMGPFEPHRLGLKEMEYTTLPKLMQELKDRWVDAERWESSVREDAGENVE
ncbi:MAG: fructose-1,6-bisphosphatase [Candidatus Hydrothermae bacterium]|nr:fructose-1,6-bisphosphatase [Candidatus Hydrothermae bacterium]